MLTPDFYSLRKFIRRTLKLPFSFSDDYQEIYLSREIKYCYFLLHNPASQDGWFGGPRIDKLKSFIIAEKTDITVNEYRILSERLLYRLSQAPKENNKISQDKEKRMNMRSRVRSHSAPNLDNNRSFENYYPYMRVLKKAKWECVMNVFSTLMNIWETKPFWAQENLYETTIKELIELVTEFVCSNLIELRKKKCRTLQEKLAKIKDDFIKNIPLTHTGKSECGSNVSEKNDLEIKDVEGKRVFRWLIEIQYILSSFGHLILYNSLLYEFVEYMQPHRKHKNNTNKVLLTILNKNISVTSSPSVRLKAKNNKKSTWKAPDKNYISFASYMKENTLEEDDFSNQRDFSETSAAGTNEIKASLALQSLAYKVECLSEELDDDKMVMRKNYLQEYFRWKMKNWKAERKILEVKRGTKKARKPTTASNTPKIVKTLVCKICLKKIRAEKMSQHSDACFTRTHIAQEMDNTKRQLQKFIQLSQEQKRKFLLKNKMERNTLKKKKSLNKDLQPSESEEEDQEKKELLNIETIAVKRGARAKTQLIKPIQIEEENQHTHFSKAIGLQKVEVDSVITGLGTGGKDKSPIEKNYNNESSSSSDENSASSLGSKKGKIFLNIHESSNENRESEPSEGNSAYNNNVNSTLRKRRESKNLTSAVIGPLKTKIPYEDGSQEVESPDLTRIFVDSPLVNPISNQSQSLPYKDYKNRRIHTIIGPLNERKPVECSEEDTEWTFNLPSMESLILPGEMNPDSFSSSNLNLLENRSDKTLGDSEKKENNDNFNEIQPDSSSTQRFNSDISNTSPSKSKRIERDKEKSIFGKESEKKKLSAQFCGIDSRPKLVSEIQNRKHNTMVIRKDSRSTMEKDVLVIEAESNRIKHTINNNDKKIRIFVAIAKTAYYFIKSEYNRKVSLKVDDIIYNLEKARTTIFNWESDSIKIVFDYISVLKSFQNTGTNLQDIERKLRTIASDISPSATKKGSKVLQKEDRQSSNLIDDEESPKTDFGFPNLQSDKKEKEGTPVIKLYPSKSMASGLHDNGQDSPNDHDNNNNINNNNKQDLISDLKEKGEDRLLKKSTTISDQQALDLKVETKKLQKSFRRASFSHRDIDKPIINFSLKSSAVSINQRRLNKLNLAASNVSYKSSFNNDNLEVSDKLIRTNSQPSDTLINLRQNLTLYNIKDMSASVEMKQPQLYKSESPTYKNALVEVDEINSTESWEDFSRGYFSDSILYTRTTEISNSMRQEKIGIKDFEFINLINKGAFGKVWLVKRRSTEDYYAMKIVNFLDDMNKNKLKSLEAESKVYEVLKSDFVVKALFKFTHETFLCFVMEYMIGGDFGQILGNLGALDEPVARFYIAELILAVEHLHTLGIVHRDLKPENILLDSNGHIKLTDFGLSEVGVALVRNIQMKKDSKRRPYKDIFETINITVKDNAGLRVQYVEKKSSGLEIKIESKAQQAVSRKDLNQTSIEDSETLLYSPLKPKLSLKQSLQKKRIIGTPDYIAPEILDGSGLDNPSVDWWSVGVILFELIVGIPPFNDDSIEEIFSKIINLQIPWADISIGRGENEMSPEACDLIKKLLTPDPAKRLGANNVSDIKNHPFFEGFLWENLKSKDAPIIPKQIYGEEGIKLDSRKKFSELEKQQPFIQLPKDEHEARKARQILEAENTFTRVRFDLLHLENKKNVELLTREPPVMNNQPYVANEQNLASSSDSEKEESAICRRKTVNKRDSTFDIPIFSEDYQEKNEK